MDIIEKDERRPFGDYTKIPITGVWLRRFGDEVQVLVEINGEWRKVITENVEGSFSRFAECVDDGSRWPLDNGE